MISKTTGVLTIGSTLLDNGVVDVEEFVVHVETEPFYSRKLVLFNLRFSST